MYPPFVNRVLKKIFDISNSSENLYVPGSPWAQGADSPYQGEMARRAKRGRDAGPKGLRGFERHKFRSALKYAANPLCHLLRKCTCLYRAGHDKGRF